MNDKYLKTAEIMVSILPLIENENFALKGGTAINLFIQDLPRLSIDIDLTYLPIQERKKSYEEIHSYLDGVKKTLSNKGFHVTETSPNETRLVAQKRDIKIYVSLKSSYRSVEWEKSKGRSGYSEHTYNFLGACDITCDNFKENKGILLEALIASTRYTRLAVYNGFIHGDYRNSQNDAYVYKVTNGSWVRDYPIKRLS